jgi:hypothetical protein
LKCHFFSHQTSLSHYVNLVHHHGGNRLINRRRSPQRPHTQPWLWIDLDLPENAWLAVHVSSVRHVVTNVTFLKCDLISRLGSLCTAVTLSITTMAITIQAGPRPQGGPSVANRKANTYFIFLRYIFSSNSLPLCLACGHSGQHRKSRTRTPKRS